MTAVAAGLVAAPGERAPAPSGTGALPNVSPPGASTELIDTGEALFAGLFIVEAVHDFTPAQVRTIEEVADSPVQSVSVGQVYLQQPRTSWLFPVTAMVVSAVDYAEGAGRPALALALAKGAVVSKSAARLLSVGVGDLLTPSVGRAVPISDVVDDALLGGRQIALSRMAPWTGALRLPAEADYVIVKSNGRDVPSLVATMQRALPDKRLRAVTAPRDDFFSPASRVLTQSEVQERFGAFGVDAGAGSFRIEPQWVDQNIEKATIPLLGTVACHRSMLPDLIAAMNELVARGLDSLVDSEDFRRAGGCFAPRLVRFDSGISRHAWGIAVDINVADNPLGAPSRQDPRLVDIMARNNFTWGGRWTRPDAAHFEWFGTPSRSATGS